MASSINDALDKLKASRSERGEVVNKDRIIPKVPKKPVVILADDSRTVIELYSSIIKEHFDVNLVIYDNGEDVVNTPASRVDLILLDLYMKGSMDGFEVLEILRETSRFNEVPIVVISSAGDKENVVKAVRQGATDFLVKPTSKNLIVDKISFYLKCPSKNEVAL